MLGDARLISRVEHDISHSFAALTFGNMFLTGIQILSLRMHFSSITPQ